MSEHASRSLCHSWAVCYCSYCVTLLSVFLYCVFPVCMLMYIRSVVYGPRCSRLIDRYYSSIKSKLHWLNLPHSSIGYYRRHWLPMIQWKTICSQELSLIVGLMWWKDRGGDWRHRSEVKVVNGRSVFKKQLRFTHWTAAEEYWRSLYDSIASALAVNVQ